MNALLPIFLILPGIDTETRDVIPVKAPEPIEVIPSPTVSNTICFLYAFHGATDDVKSGISPSPVTSRVSASLSNTHSILPTLPQSMNLI